MKFLNCKFSVFYQQMAPSAELKERINKLIKEKKVFVVSKSFCPFCVTAKVRVFCGSILFV